MKSKVFILMTLPLMIFAAEWQSLNGPPAGRADDLTIGKHLGQYYIYAADQTHKLYKSENEGELWVPIEHEDIINPTCVITDLNEAWTVYIGEVPVSPNTHCVWKSTDGGVHWNYKDQGITNTRPLCFVMDPNNSSIVYLGCSSGPCAVFKTENGGDTWDDKPLPTSHSNPTINDLAIFSDPVKGIYIHAASSGGGASNDKGIWTSYNGGETWEQTLSGVPIHSVEFASASIAFAGSSSDVYKGTKTAGIWSWSPLNNSPEYMIISLKAITVDKIYAATNKWMFMTEDGGATWDEINEGIYTRRLLSLIAHPDNPQTLFVGGVFSVYKTTDGGGVWWDRANGFKLLMSSSVSSVTPYVYVVGAPFIDFMSVSVSLDDGTNWYATEDSLNVRSGCTGPISYIEANYVYPETAFVGYQKHMSDDCDHAGCIWRTTNAGDIWEVVYQPNIHPAGGGNPWLNCITANPIVPQYVYAGYEYHSTEPPWDEVPGFVRSGDYGAYGSWEKAMTGMNENDTVYSIAVSPQNGDVIYAGIRSHGVYKSTNNGDNWTQTPFNNRTINALAIDFDYPDTIYAGSEDDYGIYRTTDGFVSFPPQVNNGLDYLYIADLEIDPEEPTIVYALSKANASASATFVYCTVDRGGRWFDITAGLPTENVSDLEIDRDEPDPVHAATESGVFTYTPDFNKSLVSSIDTATKANNGRNMMRVEGTNEIWVTYESGGVIYVTRTTNGRSSWSQKMELGQGSYPVISYDPIAETPVPGVVWHYRDEENQHYIYFARHITGSQWSDPVVIVTSMSAIDPPSFAIAGGNWGHLAYTEGSAVKYRKFYIFNPLPTTPEWVGTGHNPSIGYMMSVTNPNIHITWENSDQIWYRHEPFGIGPAERVSHQSTTCHHPSLTIEGNVVYFVWEASGDISWRSFTCNHPFYRWGLIKPVCFTMSVPSTYPVLTGGHFCSWVEEHTNNYEVYFSHYNPDGDSWTTPQNISNGATETFSNYPHINHYQTLLGTNVYFIWTEGSEAILQPTAPPYEIIFKTHVIGGLGEGGENALPMYVAQCGEQRPSPFTIRREGYTHYGSEPYKKIDYDAEYLEYQFANLNPRRLYGLGAYLYQRGHPNLPISAKVDNYQTGAIDLPPDTLIILRQMLPTMLYEDSTINVKIFGNNAVTAILVLYEYEIESNRGGPQSSQSLPDQAGVLALSILPNPAKENIGVRYTLPMSTNVKLTLFDVTGRVIEHIVNDNQVSGTFRKSFSNTDLSQGVYFVQLESDDQTLVKKVILLR